jgi:hypothetical protein
MNAFSLPTWLKPGGSTQIFAHSPNRRPNLSSLARLDETQLPRFVRESEVALKYLRLLGPLNWSRFPDRPDQRFALDIPPLSYVPFIAAYLVKIDQHLPYVSDLRQYLIEHPALVWVLGFPLVPSSAFSWGFDVARSLPSHRHFSRLLRSLSNPGLQFLLDETVRLIQAELRSELDAEHPFGDCISLDTKLVIAWVKENNPKVFIEGRRYDKTQPPKGDPDCRLGCKRKTNQTRKAEGIETLPTPLKDAVPGAKVEIGEYFWGYGSGVVSTKVSQWGEFVLAELTQPFDQPDASYFHPLMIQTERRLGRKPRFGALDAAFDCFYVYEYFADAKGFAAVPFVQRGGQAKRIFSEDGRPHCAADRPMILRYTFWCKTTLIPHQRGRYVCPLRFPKPNGETCPIQHKNWEKGGCVTTMAMSQGARLRYQMDRDSQDYKEVYKQRTATERVNSQAVEFGIERPKLRNAASIANHNTLTYVLINLHALQRVCQRKAERNQAVSA